MPLSDISRYKLCFSLSVQSTFSDDFMPPIDSMMSLRSTRLQRDRFFTEIVIGDVFCCSVLSVNDSGLDLVLLCYACKRSREIDQLKIMVSVCVLWPGQAESIGIS